MPYGKIDCFDLSSRKWTKYINRVKQFIQLNEIKESLHVATLITVVGEPTYDLMCDLCAPETPEKKKFNDLVTIVEQHLEPRRSDIAERHIFRLRRQALGEELSVYLQSLKHLACTCNFGEKLEENLRDQFVSGLASDEMRSRLFAENKLDYKRAVELALALEAAERHAETSGSARAAGAAAAASTVPGGGGPDPPVHRIGAAAAAHQARGGGGGGGGGPSQKCWRCGRQHAPDNCRFRRYNCDECGARGHLKTMCKSARDKSDRSTGKIPRKNQFYIEMDSDSEDSDFFNIVVDGQDDKAYDTRVKGPTAHWIQERFRERARWINSPAGLRVAYIQARDRAVYRCRVDFYESQTMNYNVALDVIELPSKPVIYDDFGKEIEGVAGPYNEGSEFKLVCSVKGGMPTPRLQWQRDDVTLITLGPGDQQTTGPVKSLTLVIMNANRAHLSSTYMCIAENTLLVPSQKVSVKVDLNLKPLTVEILAREQPLSVGRKTELWCRSTGARPAANITWWLGAKLLDSITKYSGYKDANETQSLLQWVPLKEDNGQVVICRAEHSMFSQWSIESKLPLNVFYMPETTIHLGAKMNPNDIEEGDDVYFGCMIDANPPAYKVVWEHNGVILQHNPSNGVILTGNNLVFRNVSRLQAGRYTCTASNVEGDRTSQPLNISIFYKPLCKNKEMKIQGAALQEPSNVICEVEAFPPPDAFEWTLNNSVGSAKVDPDRFTLEMYQNNSTGRSILTFTPVSAIDYGTLSCRATNLAGQQVEPCVYTLLPATRPDPPSDCTVYNLTHDSLDLLCLAGYEGGLQCVYIAEVWTKEGLAVNATNESAMWNLRRLGSKSQLKLVVYAANARGRSEHVTFTVETAIRFSPEIEVQESWAFNWALGILLGAILTVSIILCLAFIASRLRHRSRDYEVALPPMKNQKIITPRRSSIYLPDDKNPDLLLLTKGQCGPQPPLYSAVVATQAKNSGSAHTLHSHTHSPTSGTHAHGLFSYSQTEAGRSVNNGLVTARPREIVTKRTPLLAAQQESRV